ncbi:MAG: hypothetical protein FWD39_05105 [Clostridiales bacterium]|nr:hypothetical protein [Clostridiales bacterium]
MKRILRPGTAWVVLLNLFSTAALIFIFSTNRDATIGGYISYVFSTYAFTVLVINLPTMVSNAVNALGKPGNIIGSFIHANEHISRYITDLVYRAKISLYAALAVNLLYATFKLIAGIHYASFWYGADAIFYIILSAVQFLMLRHLQKKGNDLAQEYRQYRFCGYLLFALNSALIGVVYQIVHQNMGYHYPGLMIYAAATFAFLCLAVAIINVVKYRKLNSPVLSAIKAISLAKALVALFALQTAMLISFGGEESEAFKNIMNVLTGGGVCLFIFVMAVFMIMRANESLKARGTCIHR